ncbi:MAG: carbohydrate-binding domain-containing protein [Candidatus Cryptobacteroides sp.]
MKHNIRIFGRMAKYFAILLAGAFLLASCELDTETGNKEKDPENTENPSDNDNNTDSTDNSTPEIDTEEDGYDSGTADDSDSDAVKDDSDIYWEAGVFDKTVTVEFNGNSAAVDNPHSGISVFTSGADVALECGATEGVEIVLSGVTSDGQLKVYGSKNVKITFNGASITSSKSIALNVQNSKKTFIHLNEGTENSLNDASSQTDESYYPEGVAASDEKRNGCIYSKGDIVFSGSGSLEVTGNKKHGIAAKKSLFMRPGVTLVVNDAVENSIKAESVTISGGYLWAKTSGDAGKCISSDADVAISGGTLKLYTSGGSTYDAESNDTSSPSGIKADGNITITGGDILCVSTGEGGKGLSADGDFIMSDGVVNVATSGGKFVYSVSQDLDSSPKGVKADGNVVIDGGCLNIQVTGRSDGSEGLESKNKITINGGEVFVYAYDDAINAGDNNPEGIEINGGRVFAFSDNNDGIDSNGKLWINGGVVISAGSSGMEQGFDCDKTENFIVTGGILIGTAGGSLSTSSTSTQRSVIYNGVNGTSGEFFVVCDSDNTPILMYKLPQSMNPMCVFYSSPDIKSGSSYNVYSGGSVSGNTDNWNGLYFDGTWSGGTLLGSFTSSSLTTTVGQNNSHGGGPGHGPGWW